MFMNNDESYQNVSHEKITLNTVVLSLTNMNAV